MMLPRILVIDDSKFYATWLSDHLANEAEIIFCSTLTEAIPVIKQGCLHKIVVDVHMPWEQIEPVTVFLLHRLLMATDIIIVSASATELADYVKFGDDLVQLKSPREAIEAVGQRILRTLQECKLSRERVTLNKIKTFLVTSFFTSLFLAQIYMLKYSYDRATALDATKDWVTWAEGELERTN